MIERSGCILPLERPPRGHLSRAFKKKGLFGLSLVGTEDLAGYRAHQMHLLAGQARYRLVGVRVFGNILGNEALNFLPGIRAAVKKYRHAAPGNDDRVAARPPSSVPPLGGTIVSYPT